MARPKKGAYFFNLLGRVDFRQVLSHIGAGVWVKSTFGDEILTFMMKGLAEPFFSLS
jgi:hypothetical protein